MCLATGGAADGDGTAARAPLDRTGQSDRAPYGVVGRPLNRHSPFYLGFLGALGAVVAIALWGLLGR